MYETLTFPVRSRVYQPVCCTNGIMGSHYILYTVSMECKAAEMCCCHNTVVFVFVIILICTALRKL